VKVLAAIAALPAAAAAIWLLLHTPLAARLGAAPREDRWHERTTPVLGGIGIFAGILTGFWVAVAVGAAPASRPRSSWATPAVRCSAFCSQRSD
jgi:UDP-N-acetylmuramyl pentapeptide phosphotransferase/UDP-N-acetylglucosamine-1-phosphate transferase